jgi:hypothetical protein
MPELDSVFAHGTWVASLAMMRMRNCSFMWTCVSVWSFLAIPSFPLMPSVSERSLDRSSVDKWWFMNDNHDLAWYVREVRRRYSCLWYVVVERVGRRWKKLRKKLLWCVQTAKRVLKVSREQLHTSPCHDPHPHMYSGPLVSCDVQPLVSRGRRDSFSRTVARCERVGKRWDIHI